MDPLGFLDIKENITYILDALVIIATLYLELYMLEKSQPLK